MFKYLLYIVFLGFLFSCSSTEEKKVKTLSHSQVNTVSKYLIFTDNKYLKDGLDIQSAGILNFAESREKADFVIELKETVEIDRTLSAKMLANTASILVGYFFYAFDIETSFQWDLKVISRSESFTHKSFLNNNYPYLGYINQYEHDLEKRHIFYQDMFEEERAELALKSSTELIVKLATFLEKQ